MGAHTCACRRTRIHAAHNARLTASPGYCRLFSGLSTEAANSTGCRRHAPARPRSFALAREEGLREAFDMFDRGEAPIPTLPD
jgi:hypothetical protein